VKHKSLPRASIALGLAFLAFAAGCGDDDDEAAGAASASSGECQPKLDLPTMQEGVLKVVGPTYPPLFTYENGEMGGVDGEQLKQIAEDACLEVEVKLQPAAGVIPSIESGRADVAAGGWYISPERAEIVGQSEPNYGDPPMLVSKTGSARIEDFEGVAIGTTQGYLWEDDFKKFAGDDGKLYQSPDAVFADLKAGRIEVALMAVNEAGYRLKQSPDTDLKAVIMEPSPVIAASERPSVTNFPHTKGVPELTAALNEAIANMRESGQTAEILEQYGLDPKAANPAG
jgi:polar amino acid transport system substrate-binding protein